jgi:peptidoglycan hydrolase CwlO-like protein
MDSKFEKMPIDVVSLIQTVIDNQQKDKDVHWTVKIFGSVVVSVAAIVIIGAFQTAFQSISDCNKSIQQQSSLMQTKESTKPIWENLKEIRAELKALEQQNRDLQNEIQRLKK